MAGTQIRNSFRMAAGSMGSSCRASIFVVLLSSACGISAFGQADTATITGIITDPSGAAVPGATVEAANHATGLKYRENTNATGVYSVTALPIGVYKLSVTHAGFQTVERSELQAAYELNKWDDF